MAKDVRLFDDSPELFATCISTLAYMSDTIVTDATTSS